ncbi:stress transcription factor A [Seminavis robusta]|uniref:Stress transcription factor A n=1 Tax=Seminavis robusta TaxID=568900 RepID=A0A9N8EIX5_9STRA|nr:stress transcription factor A [Seminavis robusta]|eukprot:Sro1210_g252740.1 stress transcription factor A (289) ;mRNA; f:11507-12463
MVSKPDTTAAFPVLLYRMLEDIENVSNTDPTKGDMQSIVSWERNGTAFKVHDKKRFISIVLPAWFPRIKHSSWVRLVNSFGFKKINEEGEEQGFIHHEMFVRGRPDLVKTIQKNKKRGKSRSEFPVLSQTYMAARQSSCSLNDMASATAPPCEASYSPQQQSSGRVESQVCLKDLIWSSQANGATPSRAFSSNAHAVPKQMSPGNFHTPHVPVQKQYMKALSDWQGPASYSPCWPDQSVVLNSDDESFSWADLEPLPFRTNQTAAEARMTNLCNESFSVVEWIKAFDE